MKKNLTLAAQIKSLTKGESFNVATAKERYQAQRIGKTLKDAGVIDFQITTRATAVGFLVIAF